MMLWVEYYSSFWLFYWYELNCLGSVYYLLSEQTNVVLAFIIYVP